MFPSPLVASQDLFTVAGAFSILLFLSSPKSDHQKAHLGPYPIPFSLATGSFSKGRTYIAVPSFKALYSPYDKLTFLYLQTAISHLAQPIQSFHLSQEHTSLAPALELFPEEKEKRKKKKALFSTYLSLWFHCILWIEYSSISLIH